MNSTRAKVFFLIGLALMPLVGFGWYDLTASYARHIASAKQRAVAFSQDAADRHTRLIAQASSVLDVLARVPSIQNADVIGCTVQLKDIRERNPWASAFGLIGLNGRPVCSDSPTFRNADLSDRAYFRGALASDQVVVSGFLVARTNGRPNVVLARAVRDAANVPNGVLVAALDLDWLRQYLAQVSSDPRILSILLDAGGTVLARYPDNVGLIGKNVAHVPDVARLLALETGTDEGLDAKGILRLSGVATIPGSGEKFVVAFEKAAVLAEADAEFNRSLVRLAILVVGAAILAWIGSELLFLRWIRRLRLVAGRLGAGAFEARADLPAAAGELATVGRALDAAAVSLAQREAALRQAEAASRNAETAARDAEAKTSDLNRYLLIAESMAHVGYWRIELPSRLQTWSPEIFRIYGLEPAAAAPSIEEAIQAYHPDDRAMVESCVAAAIEEGRDFAFDLRLVRPSGQLRHVRSRGSVERDTDGRIVALFGVFFDITETKIAEDARRATTARLEAILQTMDQGLMMVGLDDRIEVCNGRALELLGLPLELMTERPTRTAVLDYQRLQGEFGGMPEHILPVMQTAASLSEATTYERRRPNGTVLEIRTRPMVAGGLVRTYTDITSLKQAETDAREANRMLLLAEEIARVGHWHVDCATGTLTWSDEVFRIHGLEPTAGQPNVAMAIVAYHPDDRAMVETLVEQAIATGEAFAFDARIIRSDGEERFVTSQGICEREGVTGTVKAVFGVFADVTARKTVERVLRDQNRRFDLALAHMSQGLCFFSADKRLIVANARYSEMYRLRPDQIAPGTPLSAIIDARDLAGTGPVMPRESYLTWREVIAQGLEATDTEVELADGRTIAIHHQPLEDGGWVATHEDVTARRRAEVTLKESEARFRQLAETTTDVITRMNLEFIRDYVSPACRRLLGYEPEELMGERPASIMHPDDAKLVWQVTKRLVAGEVEHGTVIYRARHKDGHWLWVEASLTLLRDETAGRPMSLLTSLRDVTERKEIELVLASAKQEAEVAREAAEAASAAKTDFLASMSHEIRTPLNGVLGYADLLLDDDALQPDQRRQLEHIQGAGQALLTIVNDVLDFSKIEAGQVELEPRVFSLSGVVDTTRSIVRTLAEKKRLSLAVALEPSLPDWLIGDEDRLRQVLLNLMNNAIKFTPTGSVTLRVGRIVASDGRAQIRFAVEDTGIGIPQDKRERLFQRFSQVDGSIRREFGGTGLGLAISKSLVALMGGEVGVESEEGVGSTFWFTASLPEAKADTPSSAASDTAVRTTVGTRILLVEDIAINQELGRAVLERSGYQVDVAPDGADAIMAVQAVNYDLILMDIQMPGMDGLTATDRIRALDHPASRLPIIAMTANVMPQQIAEFHAAGMDDHVGKPFRREELLAVIERSLGYRMGQPALAQVDIPSAGVLDGSTFTSVLDLLGEPATIDMLRRLAADVSARLGEEQLSNETGSLAADAHALISTAGMLGFAHLADICREVEEAYRSTEDLSTVLTRLRAARNATIQRIETLTRAA